MIEGAITKPMISMITRAQIYAFELFLILLSVPKINLLYPKFIVEISGIEPLTS